MCAAYSDERQNNCVAMNCCVYFCNSDVHLFARFLSIRIGRAFLVPAKDKTTLLESFAAF